MITKLTKSQTEKFPHYVKKWVSIGLSTDECNIEESKVAVTQAYKAAGLNPPELFVGPMNNPLEGAIAEKIITDLANKNAEFASAEEFNSFVLNAVDEKIKGSKNFKGYSIVNQIYGNQEYWLSFYDFFKTEVGLECCRLVDGLNELSKNCGWWSPFKNIAILQHRPLEIHMDNQGRLNNANGPAIKFRGNPYCNVYSVKGVSVTKGIVEKKFGVNDIDKEKNIEVRRIMIELYGQEKYIIDSGAEIVSEDDFGVLYKKNLDGDEPFMMVKVVNSTPEADGSYKDYFIRVDPKAYGGLKTPHAAVASTWRNKDGSYVFEKYQEYNPDLQT